MEETGKKIKLSSDKGQSLPLVLVIALVMGLISVAMVRLLKYETQFNVKYMSIMSKQELASTALEHAMYQLQNGNKWFAIPAPGFQYDQEYVTTAGWYKIDIEKGNLFVVSGVRQGQSDFRTIGIKVKVTGTADIKTYYAVVKRGYQPGLISKGFINLPCTDSMADNVRVYWGDIFHANTQEGSIRFPLIHVAYGSEKPEKWMPDVYSATNIYTAVRASGGFLSANYDFDYVYSDQSPSAKSHPYSPYAKAPNLDYDIYKYYAWKANPCGYYGPATIDGVANPYYCGQSLTQVTQANVRNRITDRLRTLESAVFIDTTDGKPVVPPAAATPANTYCGTTVVSANTIAIYTDDSNQYGTKGYFFINGPLILKGDDPNVPYGTNSSRVTGVAAPDNFYYPQDSDNDHFVLGNNATNTYINNVKHYGFLYVNGELNIDKVSSSNPTTNICIFGTLYLDTYGSLTMDYDSSFFGQKPKLFIYYNNKQNMFGYMGDNVSLVTFNELTFLVPTPVPVY